MVYIIDAMGFNLKHKRFGCTTFDELQEKYLNKIIYEAYPTSDRDRSLFFIELISSKIIFDLMFEKILSNNLTKYSHH